MISLKIINSRFFGLLFALGLLSLPFACAYASTSVSIQSLSGTNVSAGQNVSFTVAASGFTNPSYSVSDSFSGSSASNNNINSSGNFSWTPSSNDIGTHNFTIKVSDSSNDSQTLQEQITVSTQASLSIQSLSPSSSISPGQTVSFTAVASGFNSPSFSVSDSFGGSTVYSGNINSAGYFSWAPSSNQIGTHTITIMATDNSGHSTTASETINVNTASAPQVTGNGSGTTAIQGLEPGNTVIVGQPVSFTVSASGFTNPVFTLQDSFSGTSVVSGDINTAGYFVWTPTQNDVGAHNLTIYVNDSSGHSADIPLSITVNVPNVTVTSITPGTTVTPNTELLFTVEPAGFTNPSYTLSDSFSGTSITNTDINSTGNFTWTPVTNQDGTHTITIYATDSNGHSANTQITVYVNSGVSIALTAPSPSATIAPGTTVVFTTDAFGFTNPAYTLVDSFPGTSIINSDINSAGNFSWTPTANDAGTHTITVSASDLYSHLSSAVATITVAGTAVLPASSSNTSASGLSPSQAQAIISLLQSFGADPSVISSVSADLGGQTTTASTASTGSGYVFTSYLSPGSTSQDVTELQTILTQQGLFSAPITGYYGTETENAVIAFQAAHGLDQLGVVGPATRAALNSLASAPNSSSSSYVFNNFLDIGSTGPDVTALQQRLTALGVYSGPITGTFGSLTQAAIEQFQGTHGISQVGYVGPATRAVLNQ